MRGFGSVYCSRVVLSTNIRAEWPYGSRFRLSRRDCLGLACVRHSAAIGYAIVAGWH